MATFLNSCRVLLVGHQISIFVMPAAGPNPICCSRGDAPLGLWSTESPVTGWSHFTFPNFLLFVFGVCSYLRNIHQSLADRIGNKFGGLMNTQSAHDIGAVHAHGIAAEIELGCNFFVRLSLHD